MDEHVDMLHIDNNSSVIKNNNDVVYAVLK
jgi:hypothetical protein